MSNSLSFNELMGESAEVLPGRETLCVTHFHQGGVWGFQQNGFGNTAQAGLIDVSALNGSLDNDAILNHLFVPIAL